jgi:hypothetical protein
MTSVAALNPNVASYGTANVGLATENVMRILLAFIDNGVVRFRRDLCNSPSAAGPMAHQRHPLACPHRSAIFAFFFAYSSHPVSRILAISLKTKEVDFSTRHTFGFVASSGEHPVATPQLVDESAAPPSTRIRLAEGFPDSERRHLNRNVGSGAALSGSPEVRLYCAHSPQLTPLPLTPRWYSRSRNRVPPDGLRAPAPARPIGTREPSPIRPVQEVELCAS